MNKEKTTSADSVFLKIIKGIVMGVSVQIESKPTVKWKETRKKRTLGIYLREIKSSAGVPYGIQLRASSY